MAESITFNEDCMAVMARYPDKYFDLAVVDPPYGINVNVNMGRRKGDKKSNYHKFAGLDYSTPDQTYFLELFRVSKNQIIWGGNYMTTYLNPSSCWLLWDKGFSEDVTFAQFEMAWTSFNSSAKKYDFNAAKQQNRIHPTEKPVALYDWIFKNYAKQSIRCGHKHTTEYDYLCSTCKHPFTVLDTHLGSGSSRIAADRAGLYFVGCELDKDYFEAQEKRFKQYKSQLNIF